MKCKQAEELLPLYAGRDLDDRSAQLMGEHLQACAVCARAASEYQTALDLTRQSAAPVFGHDVYANVRRRVLIEIENRRTTPRPTQLFASWFTPRLSWAMASAVIIVVALLAFYLMANRQSNQPQLAENPPTVNQDGPKPRAVSSPSQKSGVKQNPKRPGARRLEQLPVVAKLKLNPSARTADTTPLLYAGPEMEGTPTNDSTAPDRTLRLEIQTRDPNIRIIWFSQPATK